MCNLSTNFDKENGMMKAGSHKGGKKKTGRRKNKEILLFHTSFQTEITSKLFLDPLVLLSLT